LHTSHLERTHVGAAGPEWDFSPLERLLIAGRAAWFYLWKLCWPHPLIFVYPRWTLDAASAAQWGFPAAAIAALALLVSFARRGRRAPLAATLYFGGTLLPALGFFDVYPMRYSFVADHFQYLASLGAFALAAAGLAFLVRNAAARGVVGGAWIVLLGALAWRQGLAYESGERLYLDTLAKNPDAWMPHNNLGLGCLARGELAQAEAHFARAVELAPQVSEPESNLGAVLELSGRGDAALARYERAIALDPRNANARANALRLRLKRGAELSQRGDLDGALIEFEHALADDPSSRAARAGLDAVRGKLDAKRR
jgi:tetratricopeptide (TPR) repeat protein